MNIFNSYQEEIRRILRAMAAAGELPEGLDLSRTKVEPPR